MSNFTRPISGLSNRTGFAIYLLAICVERERGDRGGERGGEMGEEKWGRRNGGGEMGEEKWGR